MIYEYKCSFCERRTERVCKVNERNDFFHCTECHAVMERVPSFGGGLRTEHPSWLDHHVQGAIADPKAPKLTTRTEHDNYCRERGIAHL